MSLAWVLDFGAGRFAAVAHRQQLQVLHEPEVHALAFAPASAPQVLLWGTHCVPVLDFGHWTGEAPTVSTERGRVLGIYAYMPESGQTHGRAHAHSHSHSHSHDHANANANANANALGALWLAAPPVVAPVDDLRACELPAAREGWRDVSLSCWQHERCGAVPIIDLGRVFGSRPLGPSANP